MSLWKVLCTVPSKDEVPQQGWASFKFWRQDLMAGVLVSFVAVPFGVAFARASGYPDIAGLVTTIVAGFLMPLPWFRGSHLTITSLLLVLHQL